MIELFRRVSRGEITLDERRRVPSGISKHGGGALKYLNDAPELSLRDYCRLMIILSDNVATDTLMQIVNPESITSTMSRLGFRRTRVSGNLTTMHYRMYGISSTVGSPEADLVLQDRARAGKPLAAGLVDRSTNGNITTPKEMGTMFEKLYKGEIMSRGASSQMVEILKQNTNRSMIPKYLPPNTVVAHKNGATEGVRADVGIVYGPRCDSSINLCLLQSRGAKSRLEKLVHGLLRSLRANKQLDLHPKQTKAWSDSLPRGTNESDSLI